jgi:hypothetical protein
LQQFEPRRDQGRSMGKHKQWIGRWILSEAR